MIKIKESVNGCYTHTFQRDDDIFDVEANYIILAILFKILRSSVDYSQVELQSLKVTAILEIGWEQPRTQWDFRESHQWKYWCRYEYWHIKRKDTTIFEIIGVCVTIYFKQVELKSHKRLLVRQSIQFRSVFLLKWAR